MMPGTTNLPVRSITVAFGGAARPAAICRMRPFSITIVTSRCGAAPLPSITVAWVRAVVCAAALPLTSAATANTTRTFARIIPPLNIACFVFHDDSRAKLSAQRGKVHAHNVDAPKAALSFLEGGLTRLAELRQGNQQDHRDRHPEQRQRQRPGHE